LNWAQVFMPERVCKLYTGRTIGPCADTEVAVSAQAAAE
jgi:hypothetical protein